MDSLTYKSPHEFIKTAYAEYLDKYGNNPSINGRVFEYLICETLAQAGITPFYYQAKFERVPNADFDVVLYCPKSPIVLTMKVSLRERYKQADLEGLALRQVYRSAKSYLITLSAGEAPNVVKKIEGGDVAGLDKCILANDPEYTNLIEELKMKKFCIAKAIIPISGAKIQTSSI